MSDDIEWVERQAKLVREARHGAAHERALVGLVELTRHALKLAADCAEEDAEGAEKRAVKDADRIEELEARIEELEAREAEEAEEADALKSALKSALAAHLGPEHWDESLDKYRIRRLIEDIN